MLKNSSELFKQYKIFHAEQTEQTEQTGQTGQTGQTEQTEQTDLFTTTSVNDRTKKYHPISVNDRTHFRQWPSTSIQEMLAHLKMPQSLFKTILNFTAMVDHLFPPPPDPKSCLTK